MRLLLVASLEVIGVRIGAVIKNDVELLPNGGAVSVLRVHVAVNRVGRISIVPRAGAVVLDGVLGWARRELSRTGGIQDLLNCVLGVEH